jgi:hypothetical protein
MVVAVICAGTGCAGAAASRDEISTQGSSTTASADESTKADGVTDPVLSVGEISLDDADWAKTWRRLTAPSISAYGARVAGVPGRWVAVSSRDQDGLKAPPTPVSFVYRSQDGTHWHAIPLGTEEDPLQSADIAYGGGRSVVAGMRNGGMVVLDSTDGETWREQALDSVDGGGSAPTLEYVHDHFFCMNISFWGSSDGEHWAEPEHSYSWALLSDIAYGNGRYLGVGAGTQLSTNGVEWHAAPVDCDLPGACIREPLHGELVEDGLGRAFFAEGNFHISEPSQEGELRSPDGEAWQYAPGTSPDAYVGGHFVKMLDEQPKVWRGDSSDPHPLNIVSRPGMAPAVVSEPVPLDIDNSWSDGLDCTNARCFIIRSSLYLVP